ncbi:MAG: hypothetical protein LIO92_00370 [Clostridiales bacterium]|nr:hypothetical protein [Clostridiales bacterium]
MGNFISTMKSGEGITPPEAFPGLIVLAVCVLLGCLLHEMVDMALPKNLPDIVYISLVAILVSIPGLFPFSDICNVWMDKVDLMSLITVLMAYTGISIGKDLGTFKQQGAAIVIVALITFFGTFIGSVLIGQTVLGLSGVI